MTPIIIVLVIATLVAIGPYQLVINNYYWGPKGPPKRGDKKSEDGLNK